MRDYMYENTPEFSCTFLEQHKRLDMKCQHYHSGYEILFMLDGDRYAFVNDGIHHIKRGDVVVLRPYMLHYNISRDSDYYKRYLLNFSRSIFDPLLTDSECDTLFRGLHTGISHLDEPHTEILNGLFGHISHSGHRKSMYNRKRLGAKLITLIDFIKETAYVSDEKSNAFITVSDSFAAALNYINSHFRESISLDEAAEMAHLSKSHFCRVFSRETGFTFLQYMNNMRIAYAHRLLLETDMTIQQISEKAGFSSVLHFDRVFKSSHGITPSEMRKQKLQK